MRPLASHERSLQGFSLLSLAKAVFTLLSVLVPSFAFSTDLADLGLEVTDDSHEDLGILDGLEGLSLSDELALLAAEDFVVSAVRHAQPIEESPSAITVLTREQIADSNYTDLVDLLRLVPGADVYRINQGHVAVGLRSRTTYGGDRVLALIDGRDFAPAMTAMPLWMGMPIDIQSIERVEIIRGPASTLYGANALQGVINIVTRRPTEEPFAAEADAWMAGQMTHAASLRAHGTRDNLSWWASAGYDRRAPYEEPERRDLELQRARALLLFSPSAERELTMELGFSRLHGAIHALDVGRGEVTAIHPYLRARAQLGRTELQLVTEYNEFALDVDFGVNLLLNEDEEPIPIVRAPRIVQPTLSVGVIGTHHLDLFEGNRMTAGLSLQGISHMPGSAVQCPPVGPNDFNEEQCEPFSELEARFGAFVQDEWQLTDDLTFTGGLRFDLNTLSPEPAISPRAAMVWRPSIDHALRASYGRAYRKPTVLQARGHLLFEEVPEAPPELSHRLTHLLAHGIGNPDLKNEKADSYELGWRGRFLDGRLVATTDLFHGRYFDTTWFEQRNVELERGLGSFFMLPADAAIEFVNRERELPLWSWGGEATLTFKPWKRLDLRLVYGLDYFKETLWDDETGEKFVRIVPLEPMHRLSSSLRWEPLNALKTTVDVIWVAPYDVGIPDPASILLPGHRVPLGGHILLNGSLGYKLRVGETTFEVGAAAFNIPNVDVLDMPRVETGDDYFGAERLARRIRVFVRGRY